MLKRFLAAAVIAVCGAGSANAQTYDWTGFYTGFTTGYSWGNASYLFHNSGYYNFFPGDTFSHGIRGMPIGGYVGYDLQTPGGVVVGVEVSVQSSFTWLGAWNVTSPFFPASDEFDYKVHYWATVGPRAGYAFGRILAYGELGMAMAHIVTRVEDNFGGVYNAQSGFVPGVFGGVGVEMAFGEWLSLGLGYRYIALGPLTVSNETLTQIGDVPTGLFTNHDVRSGFHSLLLRAAVHW